MQTGQFNHVKPGSPWSATTKARSLPPEIDNEGNIEYKLKLVSPTPERLEHLVTQLKWRLAEGGGEAIYEIGVGDDGSLVGKTACTMGSTWGDSFVNSKPLKKVCWITSWSHQWRPHVLWRHG